MKKVISEEELELMSYDDIAQIVLEEMGEKMKIKDLFTKVAEYLNLTKEEYEKHIGDFFELLSTDKRFIMLEDGFWDLRVNHSHKIKIDNEDDDYIDEIDDEEIEEDEDDEEIEVDEDADPEDDEAEDDLSDLSVVTDTDEENDGML